LYPTLSDLLQDLTGLYIPLPIQTFGFMLAMSFLCAAWTLTLELKRKEKEGLLNRGSRRVLVGAPATLRELATTGIVGFLVGFKLVYAFFHYRAFSDNPQQVLLSADGSWTGGLAVAVAVIYQRYREKQKHRLPEPEWRTETVYPHHLVGNLTMVAALAGIAGAKVFHILENLDEFAADPWGSFSIFSGLTMYGGLICGGAAVLWYGGRHGMPWKVQADATAPGLMLAYGVGRIGCHLAGDGDWGIVNTHPRPAALQWLPDWAWAYTYPHNVNGDGIPIPGCVGRHCMMLAEPVYPTPFYEAVMCIGLFFVLWALRRRIAVPGMLFSLYLLLNGVERFFIEKIRINTKYHIAGHAITQAEIISAVLIVLGIVGLVLFRRKKAEAGP